MTPLDPTRPSPPTISLFLILAYGNVTYLGIPVLQTLLGEEALSAGALLSAVYVFWLPSGL